MYFLAGKPNHCLPPLVNSNPLIQIVLQGHNVKQAPSSNSQHKTAHQSHVRLNNAIYTHVFEFNFHIILTKP